MLDDGYDLKGHTLEHPVILGSPRFEGAHGDTITELMGHAVRHTDTIEVRENLGDRHQVFFYSDTPRLQSAKVCRYKGSATRSGRPSIRAVADSLS